MKADLPVVIGLVGPAGAGKSTVASHLIEKYGAVRYSFAALLKEIAKRTLDFSDEQLYGTQEQKEAIDPRYGFSCRTFLQKLGTEGVRNVLGADFWTTATLEKIRKDSPKLAVIDDMRFVNEAEATQHSPYHQGSVWRLCPPADETSVMRAAAAGQHASEREWLLAPFDFEIAPKKRGIPELVELVDHTMGYVL